MNELQRQAYLSALGIESYMPRWRLPFAPEPVACVLPVLELESSKSVVAESASETAPSINQIQTPRQIDSMIAVDVLANLDVRQKPVSPSPVNATSILQQLEGKKPAVIAPFSLSVWRPLPGFLIIDSRNTTLALPTDLLLGNILRSFIPTEKFKLNEEVLRWPMIENRFVSRTEADARNELQTWLAVENELRPIERIWLMGENAGKYLIGMDVVAGGSCWQKVAIAGLPGNEKLFAFLLPSLNELLQRPLDKSRLWALFD